LEEVSFALGVLRRKSPDIRQAIVKLDEGVSGWGNAVVDLTGLPASGDPAEAARQAEALGGGVLVQLRALHLRGVELAVREAELYIRKLLKDR
jgi:hypothetical protein